jgi:hypothetical protein
MFRCAHSLMDRKLKPDIGTHLCLVTIRGGFYSLEPAGVGTLDRLDQSSTYGVSHGLSPVGYV